MDYTGVVFGKGLGYDKEIKLLIIRWGEFKDKGAKPKKGQGRSCAKFCSKYI